jgi:hypothetical protein
MKMAMARKSYFSAADFVLKRKKCHDNHLALPVGDGGGARAKEMRKKSYEITIINQLKLLIPLEQPTGGKSPAHYSARISSR